jgi:hypothetical protein
VLQVLSGSSSSEDDDGWDTPDEQDDDDGLRRSAEVGWGERRCYLLAKAVLLV